MKKKTQPELVMAYGNSFPSVQIERYTSKLCRTFCKYDFDNNNNKKIIFYCILYAWSYPVSGLAKFFENAEYFC